MNINTISYLVADAFHTMKKDIKNQLISLGTMLATMILIAVAYLVYLNANITIESTKDASSNILVYLEIGLSDEKMQEVGFEIEKIPGVSNDANSKPVFYSVEDSIARAESMSKSILAGYTQEEKELFIQAFYAVPFDDIEAVPGIMAQLRNIEGVGQNPEDVTIDPYAALAQKKAKQSQIIAITAIIYIIEFSIFLMMNTTKLMVYAKRREISIMKYVGARDNFVRAPFAIQSVITALIAVAITVLLGSIIYPVVMESMDKSYIAYQEVYGELTMLLLIIGCIIGIGGSTASMNKYLDV